LIFGWPLENYSSLFTGLQPIYKQGTKETTPTIIHHLENLATSELSLYNSTIPTVTPIASIKHVITNHVL
jgi:hypothetical protein